MPILSLSNSLSKNKDRVHLIPIDEDFKSGTGAFTYVNSSLANSSSTLQITASATSGYAWKMLASSPNTKFTYSIDLAGMTPGGGGGHILIGSSVDNSDFVNVDATSVTTYTGSFTTDTATVMVLHLVTDVNGELTKWDNLSIEEDN